MNNQSNRKCLLTILSFAEAQFFRKNLIDLAKAFDSCECVLCILDAPKDEATQIDGLSSWNFIEAREYVGEPFLDKAFFFPQELFTTVCRISILAKLIGKYEVILSIQPQAFDVAKGYGSGDILPNSLILPIQKTLPSLNALFESNHFEEKEANFVIFSAGKDVRAFLSWCVQKVEYIMRHYNGYLLPLRLDPKQWDFLSGWLGYALYFDLRIDFSRSLPKTKSEKLKKIPGEYKYDRLSDGTLIHPLLRANYLRDYRLRRRCEGDPFSHAGILLNESVILGDRFPTPLTPIMSELFHTRPDLQSAFGDIREEESRANFTHWFLNTREIDPLLHDLDEPYFSAVQRASDNKHTERQNDAPSFRARLLRKVKQEETKHLAPPARPAPDPGLPKGVNLCGFIRGSFGLGEAVRILAEILDAGDIPFTVVDFQGGSLRFTEERWEHKVTNEFIYNTNIILMSPNWLPVFMSEIDRSIFSDRYNIAYFFWEIVEFPKEYLPSFDLVDEVWTAGEFLRKALQSNTEKPVTTVPLALSMADIAPLSRRDFGLQEDAFLFLMTYDPYSSSARKNPEAAVQAFLKNFDGNERARLVIKYSERLSDSGEDELLAMAEKTPAIDIIEGVFPKEKMNALIRCCDVLISLHRAEGFGLAPAEAMYLGKPVVMTNWSGNTEFMTEENCCPVDYELVELSEDIKPYSKGDHWAEPSVEHAAVYMRRLFEDKDYYEAISRKAAETMRTRFSPAVVAKVLEARLRELKLL